MDTILLFNADIIRHRRGEEVPKSVFSSIFFTDSYPVLMTMDYLHRYQMCIGFKYFIHLHSRFYITILKTTQDEVVTVAHTGHPATSQSSVGRSKSDIVSELTLFISQEHEALSAGGFHCFRYLMIMVVRSRYQ